MLTLNFRWSHIVGMMCIVLLTASCFQGVNDAPPEVLISQLEEDTATPTQTPTETVTPSITPSPTNTLIAIAQFQAQDADTLTPTPTDTPTPTETLTPTPTDTPTPTETNEPFVNPLSQDPTQTNVAPPTATEPLEVAQFDPTQTPDEFELTATALVSSITQTAGAPLTLTAAFLLQPTLTETPTTAPTFTFTPAPSGGPVLSGNDCEHQVSRGQNLFRISLFYGLPINQIAAANGIVNQNLIIAGDKLVIPGCGTTGAVPPPTFTPSATSASAAGVGNTGSNANASLPPTTTTTAFTSTCGTQYIVEQYDTLFSISLRCSVPIQAIANANGIINIDLIDIGQVLTIPASG